MLPLKKRRSTLSTSDVRVTCNPPIMPRVPIAGIIARKTQNNISVKLIHKVKILITYLKNKNVSSGSRKKNKHPSRLCEPRKLLKTTLSQMVIPKTRPMSHQQTQIAKESKKGSA